MTSPEMSTPQPERQGVGRLVLIGMLIGIIVIPIAVYFAIDVLGPFGLACSVDGGGGEDRIACSMRQLVLTGMSLPLGALLGFFISYWIACRRFKAGF
jgi:hypothetical protein